MLTFAHQSPRKAQRVMELAAAVSGADPWDRPAQERAPPQRDGLGKWWEK